MSSLKGKKVILGISACIAAYKSVQLVRDLVKEGAEVRVVMTPAASKFVSPITLSALSKNSVIEGMFPESSGTISVDPWHIEYGMWADIMVIAPASVNTVAKIAAGFADNALTTLVTAMRAPVLISPAADVDMYENPITQKNINFLKSMGYWILEAESGELASGLIGKGRLPELSKIRDTIESILLGKKEDLRGKKILVTAGPTFEDIDPVRYIGNRSSGKMGVNIATAALLRGADVTLIHGPISVPIYQGIKSVAVRSARDMNEAVQRHCSENDVLIMSAAVADYRPEILAENKIKKEQHLESIALVENPDILAGLTKQEGQLFVGFALETENARENALKKITKKRLDMIVLNSLEHKGSGFEVDTNIITIIDKEGSEKHYPLQSKFAVAHCILDEIVGKIT